MRKKLLIMIVSVCVIVTVIAGLYIAGSPRNERLRKLDDQRVQDLQRISYAIDNYANINAKLPMDVATALTATEGVGGLPQPIDPETKKSYEYRATGGTTYELCATFASSFAQNDGNPRPMPPISYPVGSGGKDIGPRFWNHGIGMTCFVLTVPPSAAIPVATPSAPSSPSKK